jgi:hypothetical protein
MSANGFRETAIAFRTAKSSARSVTAPAVSNRTYGQWQSQSPGKAGDASLKCGIVGGSRQQHSNAAHRGDAKV